MGEIEKFQQERQALNELVMEYAATGTKRFYSLDSQAYRDGALPAKTKELLGLVASVSCCAATTASAIMSSAASRKGSPATPNWRRPCSSV